MRASKYFHWLKASENTAYERNVSSMIVPTEKIDPRRLYTSTGIKKAQFTHSVGWQCCYVTRPYLIR